MELKTFIQLSKNFNLIPVYEIITADMLTPVLAYLKIREKNSLSFLLESVEGSTNMARYSFIGVNPEKTVYNSGLEITESSSGKEEKHAADIFDWIKKETSKYKQAKLDELPDFTGGIVGFIGYENISLIENTVHRANEEKSVDSILGIYNTILAFDHYKHQIILISNSFIDNQKTAEENYRLAKKRLSEIKFKLAKPIEYKSNFSYQKDDKDFNSSKFASLVNKCKQHIEEGDIFQIVLSKRFEANFTGDPFNVYRALRIINPSPYMYFLELPIKDKKKTVIGTSPEDLIKVKDKKAQLLPIAGTRRRGRNLQEEKDLENELLNDPKELAEHTMLVDLGRNDLGRFCKYNSIKLSEKMKLQKYSHVMHIVSKVEGELEDDKDSIDALRSCFPAGTVTGAPKIRAMQLIAQYEKLNRNVYAGAVGYFDFSGNMDTCIAIRTLFTEGDKIFWQSGAGIVADSLPELEEKEIKNKSAVMISALKYAEVIDENSGN